MAVAQTVEVVARLIDVGFFQKRTQTRIGTPAERHTISAFKNHIMVIILNLRIRFKSIFR